VKARQKAARRQRRSDSWPEGQVVVFRAAALLLDYPTAGEASIDADLVVAAVAELPDERPHHRLHSFLSWWLELEPSEREARYVETFDLSPCHSLHLSFWRGGEAADRAAFLLGLRTTYCETGVKVSTSELPDYLPLMLEFAAAVPDGWRVLAPETDALERLRQSLASAGSPFELVISAILAVLPPEKPAREARP
jgi:nitrate reductase molybdenum cofactor assembly chaperone NarJ/NarW